MGKKSGESAIGNSYFGELVWTSCQGGEQHPRFIQEADDGFRDSSYLDAQ